MYPHVIHVFLDGGFLRARARDFNRDLVDPRAFGRMLSNSGPVQTWAYDPSQNPNALLARIGYYDALSDDPAKQEQDHDAYWKAIELQDDVYLGFGALRGLAKKVRQKGVDTLVAVDMLVGAFSGVYDIAILAAGDADYVPVVEEVKRRGAMVCVAGTAASTSDDLRRAADRYIEIQDDQHWFPAMTANGRTFKSRPNGVA